MKTITILEYRPQFIKAAVISRLLKSQNNINEIIVHTGQYFDDNMSKLLARCYNRMRIKIGR